MQQQQCSFIQAIPKYASIILQVDNTLRQIVVWIRWYQVFLM